MLLQACFSLLSILILGARTTDGACSSFPSALQDGTWHSSDMGDVTFNSTHFHVTKMFNFGALDFECVSSGGYRYYSLSEKFTFFSNSFKVAICFKLYQQSSTKFIYYPQASVLPNTELYRIFFEEDTYSFTESETCNLNSNTPSQLRLLIKEGYVNQSSINCNNNIAGRYAYNLTSSSCNDTYVDVCTDKTEVLFNYTRCSDAMAYSAGGVLSCVYYKTQGNTVYTTLYNQDATTDETTFFRYTCLVHSTDSGVTYITTYPKACIENQNSTVIGSPGVAFTMVANSTCVTSDNEEESTTTLSAGAAVAIFIALLILFGAFALVGIWYYIKVYRLKKINPDNTKVIPAKSPPLDTKEQERHDGRVSPVSPYPTVSELAMYRFGPEIDDDDGGMTLDATTPGFTDGRRTMYDKEADRESQVSLPVYSEVGGETPDPTRLSEVQTRMSEISEANIPDGGAPFTMTRATMNIPEETTVSPIQSPTDNKDNGGDVTL